LISRLLAWMMSWSGIIGTTPTPTTPVRTND
jgi:hypothetical protein